MVGWWLKAPCFTLKSLPGLYTSSLPCRPERERLGCSLGSSRSLPDPESKCLLQSCVLGNSLVSLSTPSPEPALFSWMRSQQEEELVYSPPFIQQVLWTVCLCFHTPKLPTSAMTLAIPQWSGTIARGVLGGRAYSGSFSFLPPQHFYSPQVGYCGASKMSFPSLWGQAQPD